MSYDRSAPVVYDAIYSAMKDYPAEADRVIELFTAHHLPGVKLSSLLDVACGTGLHLAAIRKEYTLDLAGIDLSEAQLATARKRLRGNVPLTLADMTDFYLGRQFALVTCLFSAIGHVHPYDKLVAAITCMARHVTPGGVLMVEPWIQPDKFIPGHVGLNVVDTPELKIMRMVTTTRGEGNLTQLTMKHLVGRPGQPIEEFTEVHDTMMYSIRELEAAFAVAGLAFHFDEQGLMGRGLCIGVKPLLSGSYSLARLHLAGEHLADDRDDIVPRNLRQALENFSD